MYFLIGLGVYITICTYCNFSVEKSDKEFWGRLEQETIKKQKELKELNQQYKSSY